MAHTKNPGPSCDAYTDLSLPCSRTATTIVMAGIRHTQHQHTDIINVHLLRMITYDVVAAGNGC